MPRRPAPKRRAPPRREIAVYTISVASRLTALPVHTLRWLELNRFVRPARTDGNQRLFSDADVELLREIALLLEHRVNLAGIRAILTIKREHRISRLTLEHLEDEEEP